MSVNKVTNRFGLMLALEGFAGAYMIDHTGLSEKLIAALLKIAKPIPVVIALLFTCMPAAHGKQAAGIYAYVDLRGDSDSRAKVVEFTTASQNKNGYFFRIMSGRQIKVAATRYRGAVYYPSVKPDATAEQLKQKLAELRAFEKRFPASSLYTVKSIAMLSQKINRLENPTVKKEEGSNVTLVLKTGEKYESVIIREKTPGGLKIFHKAGPKEIPYENLPDEIIKQVGAFDKDAAIAYRLDKANKQLAANQREKEYRRLHTEPMCPPGCEGVFGFSGVVLSVFDEGLLVTHPRSGKLYSIRMSPRGYVDGDLVNGYFRDAGDVFKYTAANGAAKTVELLEMAPRSYIQYMEELDAYEKRIYKRDAPNRARAEAESKRKREMEAVERERENRRLLNNSRKKRDPFNRR